jgi:hypothetical protein
MNMKHFYYLLDLVKSTEFEAMTDEAMKSKAFIKGILAGESVLNAIDKKMLGICKVIIKSCGVDCKTNFDVSLKAYRSQYWNKLVQYVCRFLDKDSSISLLKKLQLHSTRTVCCSACVCLEYVKSRDCGNVCATCKHGLEFHVSINIKQNINMHIDNQNMQQLSRHSNGI